MPLRTPLEKKFGVKLAPNPGDRLCNLRFADDLLLIASTKRELKIMIADLVESAKKAGLEIHPVKTQILANEYINEPRGKLLSIGSKCFQLMVQRSIWAACCLYQIFMTRNLNTA